MPIQLRIDTLFNNNHKNSQNRYSEVPRSNLLIRRRLNAFALILEYDTESYHETLPWPQIQSSSTIYRTKYHLFRSTFSGTIINGFRMYFDVARMIARTHGIISPPFALAYSLHSFGSCRSRFRLYEALSLLILATLCGWSACVSRFSERHPAESRVQQGKGPAGRRTAVVPII
jgi:hypothetical protein